MSALPMEDAHNPVRIVVVDDHESVRESICRIVSLQDDMVVLGEASDGLQALKVVERTSPDLVLVDIRMPGMDGLELIQRLRASYPQLKIVALSAHEDELYVSEALKHGADTYVLKGTPLKDLIGTIRRVMQGRVDLPSEVTEPLINRFRLADDLLGILDQSFFLHAKGEDPLSFLARSLARLCGGSVYALVLRVKDGMEVRCSGRVEQEGDEETAWILSTRDLEELADMIEARHPLVCNEHRLRDKARGWGSPMINLVISPIFHGGELRGYVLAGGNKPFRLSPPLIRYLGILSDQAASFCLRQELEKKIRTLETANRKLRALLAFAMGEMAHGEDLERLLSGFVEGTGVEGMALLSWREGGWKILWVKGLSSPEVSEVVGDMPFEGFALTSGGNQVGLTEYPFYVKVRNLTGRQLLAFPLDPTLGDRAALWEANRTKEWDGDLREAFLPSYLLLVSPGPTFCPEEETEVLQGLVSTLRRYLRERGEESW